MTPLKARRLALGFSLRDVEQITDGEVSNAYLSQLENGKIKSPSLHVCLHLSAAYATPMETVAGWFGHEVKTVPPRICEACGQALPMAASAIDARSGETRQGLDPEGTKARAEGDAQAPLAPVSNEGG